MEVVLLRTLTLKSILGYFKFPDKTVEEVFNAGHTRVLRWHYYCVQNITFTEDVLKLLNIPPDLRIKKPGIDKEIFEKINTINQKSAVKNGDFRFVRMENAIKKKKKYKAFMINNNVESKLSMRNKNQGKKY